jgi:hypothetical protein
MEAKQATVEKIGKRWYIRLSDGSLLKFKTGKTRYFNAEYMANFICSDINEQEKKQISDKA